MKNKTDKELLELYKSASTAYYDDGEPIITDNDFDALESIILSSGLELPSYQTTIYGETASHITIMLSLKKCNVDGDLSKEKHDEIIKHLSKSDCFNKEQVYTLGYKFDGLAINAVYENINGVNTLKQAITRGDDGGLNGRNVTDKLRHLIPKTVDGDIKEVRYECIVRGDVFLEKYSNDYSHPRNLASGIVNNNDINDTRKFDLSLIKLHSIDINGNFINGNDGIEENYNHHNLSKNYNHYINYNDLINYDTFLESYNNMLKYRPTNIPTDGLVLSPIFGCKVSDYKGNYPNHSISIKFPPKGTQAIVSGIEWNLSKVGEYTPVVLLEPVVIDGRTFRRTHGFNYGFIKQNGINKGAKITINISGDIIPYLVSVLESSVTEHVLPQNTYVDGCHLLSNDCDAIKVEKFVSGAETLKLKHFGESFYRSIASYYMFNPINMFNKTLTNKQSLLYLGLSENKVDKFLQTIKEKESIKLCDVIYSISYDGCGESTSLELSKYLAVDEYLIDDKHETEFNFSGKNKSVIESGTVGELRNLITENVKTLINNGIEVIFADKKQQTEQINIILTGSPKEFGFKTKQDFLKHIGNSYKEVKNIKDVKILITDDLLSTSSKMVTAKKLGIEIVDYGSF